MNYVVTLANGSGLDVVGFEVIDGGALHIERRDGTEVWLAPGAWVRVEVDDSDA